MLNKTKRIYSIIICCLYIIVCSFSLCYENTLKNVIGNFLFAPEDAPDLDVHFSEISDWHKGTFPYRQTFLDIYGLNMKLFDKRVIGDFSFFRDDYGYIYVTDPYPECDMPEFVESMNGIQQNLYDDQVLLYVAYPNRTDFFDYKSSPEVRISGDASRAALDALKGTSIECMDMEDLFYVNSFGLNRENINFKTDGHKTTETELWIASSVADVLRSKGICFYDEENTLDYSSYDVSSYEFLGNSGRNVGRYYVGTDTFNIYKPRFNTNITLSIPDSDILSTGSFEQTVLNGYEDNPHDIYTYWVTDYGHFGSPCYYYINNLAPDNAAKVLFICDSSAMRAFSYLTLSCKKVTVLDPRCFGDVPYISNELDSEHYDAVIVIGLDTLMYNAMR